MPRRITYHHAANAFVFTALWLVIGAIALWSPIPGALGIAGEMFAAWLMLFFVIMSVAGSLLTVAALNAAFPPQAAAQARDARALAECTDMGAANSLRFELSRRQHAAQRLI
jgi:hypothetical protein